MVAPVRWKITRSSSKASRRSSRAKLVGAAAVAGAAVGAAVFVGEQRRSRLNANSSSPKLKKPFKISPIVADALAGAAGEIAQLSSLYPLDTIKVVQQAADCSLGGALKLLAPAGAKPAAVLAAFYRGCLPACVASAAVGAVYLVSFSGTQRAWERAAVKGGRGVGGRTAALPSAAAAVASSSSSDSDDVALNGALDASAAVPFASLTVSAAVVASSSSSSSPSSTSTSTSSSSPSSQLQSVHAHVQAEAATAGAVVASVMTSLMESPLELFRHRAQAVVVGGGAGAAASAAAGAAGAATAGAPGSVLAQASAAFAAGGVKELYRGLAPYVLKSAPYDISELLVYSMLRGRGGGNGGEGGDGTDNGDGSSSTSSTSSHDSGVFSLLPTNMRPPPQLAHAVLGAVAGAAAVVASMPADCIKLKLELSSAPVAHGLRESVGQFFGTGRAIAAGPGGPSALFRGMGPRLAEKVPSTMIYWVVVEAARKALAPHVYRGEEEEQAVVSLLESAKGEKKKKKKGFFRRSSQDSTAAASSPSGGDFVMA